MHYWHKTIWKPNIPPRFFISLWLGLQGRLKTADRLKFLNITQVCILCNTCDETNAHIFFACSAANAVWSRIKVWLKLRRRMSSISMAIKWLERERGGSGVIRKARWLALAVTVSHIWFARNNLLFEDRLFDVVGVVKDVQMDVFTVFYSISQLR